ncbi:MAG: phospholipid carrier-dependent glycosyltransferase [Fimbriimonadaceae bacterium]|nr:phospholipid carrier-dependent glycosyltransferase [Fimbriimonadaceae bacterium]
MTGKRLVAAVGAGLFLFAFALRLIGIGWGLKNDLHHHSYHPDEPVVFAVSQAIVPTQAKFTPGFYNYGTGYLTFLRVVSDVVSGYTGGPGETADSLWSYVSRVHLAGRIATAAMGAGTVLFVFLLLRRFLGWTGSLTGALLIAVAPAHVVHSRFQTVDVPATFWLAVAAWAAMQLFPTPGDSLPNDPSPNHAGPPDAGPAVPAAPASPSPARWVTLSAIAVGLSAGTKYTGILGLVTVIIAIALHHRPQLIKWTALAIGVALLTFVISTPGVVLENERFMQDFRYEMTHTQTGHGLVFTNTGPGFLYHLINLVFGVGFVLTLLSLFGVGLGVAQRHGWLLALLAFTLLYYLLIGRAEVKFLRYTFPLLIGLAASFGLLMEHCQRRQWGGQIVVALGLAGLGGLDPGGGLRQAALLSAFMAGEDPRDTTVRHLRAKGGTVGLASDPWFYTPPTFSDAGAMRTNPLAQRLALMSAANPPTVYRIEPNGDNFAFNVRLITDDRPDRVVISSFEAFDPLRLYPSRESITDPTVRVQVDRAHEFYEALRRDYELETAFGGGIVHVHDLEYIRPEITVWKRKSTAAP